MVLKRQCHFLYQISIMKYLANGTRVHFDIDFIAMIVVENRQYEDSLHPQLRDVIYDVTGMSGMSHDVTGLSRMSHDITKECV